MITAYEVSKNPGAVHFIPEEHPIRRIKPIVESALARLSSLPRAGAR